jgi:hypothetical protein
VANYPQIARAGRAIEEPMRWKEAEQQANGFVTDVLQTWFDQGVAKIIAWLPGNQTIAKASSKAKMVDLPRPPHLIGCGCGNCQTREKGIDTDLMRLRMELSATFSQADLNAFDRLFDDVLRALFTGPGTPTNQQGVFNLWYRDVYQEGLNQAYRDGVASVKTADPVTRKWFQKNVGPIYSVDNSFFYASDILANGMQLVTAAVTKKFKAKAMSILTDGVLGGVPWSEIAETMFQEIGVGSLFHWERLVRTEMLITYDKSSRERYANMRAQWVRFSITAGACQKCRDIMAVNRGYYRLYDAPALPAATHPMCKCRWVPKFSLPRGVSV